MTSLKPASELRTGDEVVEGTSGFVWTVVAVEPITKSHVNVTLAPKFQSLIRETQRTTRLKNTAMVRVAA